MAENDNIELPDSSEYEQFSPEDRDGMAKDGTKRGKNPNSGRKEKLHLIDLPAGQKITGQERNFVLEYYMSGNATLAMKKAGYPVSTNTKAADLLKNPRIKTYMNEVVKAHEEQINLEKETFINLIKYIVVAKVDDFMDDFETLKDMSDIPTELLHAIKEVTVNDYKNAKGQVTRTKTTLKLHDKQPYMDMWAKIRNFYSEHNNKTQTIEIKYT